jgi:hypothetical protein
MQPLAVPLSSLAGAVLCVAVTACGSNGTMPGEVGTYVGDDGGVFTGASGEGGAFAASVSASQAALCPGQCVDLTVAVSGGTAPYTYAWSDGSEAMTATRHVCPTSTTVYSVDATDSSGRSGELSSATLEAHGSATVTVGSSCGSGAGPPFQMAHTICSVEWPWTPSPLSPFVAKYGGVVATVDPAGNTLVAITYGGTLVAGGTTFTAQGVGDALVAKLDPQCHIVWMKNFGAPGAGIQTTNIASDAASDVIFGGYFNGNVDFGFGPPQGGSDPQNRDFVVRLSASGAPLSVAPEYGNSNLDDLTSDSQGNVAFSLIAPGTDFDAGAINASFYGVVRLTPSGTPIYTLDESELAAFNRSGTVLSLGGNAAGAVVAVGPGDPTAMGSQTLVGAAVEIAPDGTLLWSTPLTPPAPPAQYLPPSLDSVDGVLDPTGDAFAFARWEWESSDQSTFASVATVTRIQAAGGVRWATATSDLVTPLSGFAASGGPAALAVDVADDTFVVGSLTGNATIGALGMATSTGTQDAAFLVLDASGALRAAGHWGVPGSAASAQSIALDGAGVVVAGTVYDAGTATGIFVVNLGW